MLVQVPMPASTGNVNFNFVKNSNNQVTTVKPNFNERIGRI